MKFITEINADFLWKRGRTKSLGGRSSFIRHLEGAIWKYGPHFYIFFLVFSEGGETVVLYWFTFCLVWTNTAEFKKKYLPCLGVTCTLNTVSHHTIEFSLVNILNLSYFSQNWAFPSIVYWSTAIILPFNLIHSGEWLGIEDLER